MKSEEWRVESEEWRVKSGERRVKRSLVMELVMRGCRLQGSCDPGIKAGSALT